MYLKPSKEWLAKRRTGKESWKGSCRRAPAIGRFFEDVAAVIWNGQRPPRESIGDLYIPGAAGTFTLIEVKSFGDSHGGLRIPDIQFELIGRETGFHVSRLCYAAFFWRSRIWIKSGRVYKSILTGCHGASQCANAIISNTEHLYLLDPELIRAIRLKYGSRQKLLANPEESCTLITGELLKQLKTDFAGTLREIGLNPRNWAMCERQISIPFLQCDEGELELGLDIRMNIHVTEVYRTKVDPVSIIIPDEFQPVRIRGGKIIQPELPF